MTSADCPFCRKIAQHAYADHELVWSFPHSVALLGPWQFYSGYCVVVSRTHAKELHHLADDARQAYLDEMCTMAAVIEKVMKPHKINYELLGNQVPHLHWHLFPRSLDDPNRLSAVWLDLALAEKDEEIKKRLQTSKEPREATIARLREELQAMGAKQR
jgi:diadenosine tetraphosphate (Ap4A) HIT family hydrolase